MTNNPTIDGVSREQAADSLFLTMWPNDTLHECERGNPLYEACLKAVDAGYAKDAPDICPTCDSRGAGCPDCKPEPEPPNDLREHCKQCAEVVKTWPEWKQNCLGGAPAVEQQEPEFPAGAIHNGRAFIDQLESTYAFKEQQGHPLSLCSEWQELVRCFEWLATHATEAQATMAQLRIDLGNQTELTKQADYHASQRGNEIAQLQAEQ